jgi:hypothetical protein
MAILPENEGIGMSGYWVDIAAVGFFVLEWLVYGITLEHSAYGRDSLSARMNRYREVWVRRLLDREARMVDMQIMRRFRTARRSLPPPACLRSAARWRCCGRPMMRSSS